MGLMDLFRRKNPTKNSGDTQEPTAIDYVEWLLQHMLSASRMELMIDTDQELPGNGPLPEDVTPPPCIPDAQTVINRLKILSGVNPVMQTKTVEGTFERPRVHHALVFTSRFQDTDMKSTCALRLRIRALS